MPSSGQILLKELRTGIHERKCYLLHVPVWFLCLLVLRLVLQSNCKLFLQTSCEYLQHTEIFANFYELFL